jgi:MFS transporter, DHA1 family, tetracycline resistance protein
MNSLVSIAGPLAISTVYFAFRARFPGLVWIAGAALYLVSLPAFFKIQAKNKIAPLR